MARRKRKAVEPTEVSTAHEIETAPGTRDTIRDMPETVFLEGDEEGAEVLTGIPRGELHPEWNRQGGLPYGAESRTHLPDGMRIEVAKKEGYRDGLREVYEDGEKMTITLACDLKWDGVRYNRGDSASLPVAMVQRKPWLSEAGMVMEEYRTALAQNVGSAVDKYNILNRG